MELRVRRAEQADVEAVRAVAAASWRETYRGLLRDETIELFLAGPYSSESVARRIARDEFFVVEIAAGIVAYVDAVLEEQRILLAAIYALPGRGRQGAGTALLGVVANLRHDLPIDADVLDGNRKGEAFYERRGFRPVESIEGELFGEAVTERRWRRPPLDDHPLVLHIRPAAIDDAAPIARIYNEGIEDRLATLETVPRTAEERRDWLAGRSARHPVLVAVDSGGAVLGWGSLNPFNLRAAYDLVADLSVYVARDRRGVGIGGVILAALEDEARRLGYHKMVLAALARNDAGTRLYSRHGFSAVGTYREQGMLDGEWVDVIVMEKLLD